MKIIGIITEYNPFHNGHQYQIQEIRKKEQADYVIVAMSGDYVQRGGPSMIDKYTRTRMALSCGADLVLMLPVSVSLSSARNFALGGVGILSSLGVDCLTYGCETPDTDQLRGFASFFQKEDPLFSAIIKEKLKEGCTYPLARQEAFVQYQKQYAVSSESLQQAFPGIQPDPALLGSPNNILGIEYETAILDLNANIGTSPIKRIGKGYHDTDSTHEFSSASAIRNHIMETTHLPQNGLPKVVVSILEDALNSCGPIHTELFSNIFEYELLHLNESILTNYQDCSKELSHRILSQKDNYQSFTQFLSLIKTKGYTQTRIQRLFMQILLKLTSLSYERLASCNYAPYARVLGFRSESEPLFAELKKRSSIPILTSLSQARTILENHSYEILKEDLYASDLYRLIQKQHFHVTSKNDYKQPLIIL